MSRGVSLLPFLIACSTSYRPTLPEQPSPEQRIATFTQLRSKEHAVTITRRCEVMDPTQCTTDRHDALVLANGEKITDVDALEPLVRADSATAKHVARASRARGWSIGLSLGAVATAITGFAVAFTGREGSAMTTQTKVGVGIMVGSLVPMIAALVTHYRYRDATVEAFTSYTPDLAARLNVCAQGLAVVACEDMGGPPGATH